MNADEDIAKGYKRNVPYICRNCGELIYVHNRQWDHIGRDFWEGIRCKKKNCAGKEAQPVPFGVMQPFNECNHKPKSRPFVCQECMQPMSTVCPRCGNDKRMCLNGKPIHIGKPYLINQPNCFTPIDERTE